MAGLRSVASFAISSTLSFPSIPMCPGTHDTLIVACLFLSRKLIAVSTNFCETCWLDPGDFFVIAETEAVLSTNSTILLRFSFAPGVSCWNSIAVSKPLSSASISALYTLASVPFPHTCSSFLSPSSILPIPLLFCVSVPSPSLNRQCK